MQQQMVYSVMRNSIMNITIICNSASWFYITLTQAVSLSTGARLLVGLKLVRQGGASVYLLFFSCGIFMLSITLRALEDTRMVFLKTVRFPTGGGVGNAGI